MPLGGHLEWNVPYAPGTLEARGYHGMTVAATERVETTGPPAKLILTPDRSTINADGQDVSCVTVSAVDSQGRAVPDAQNLVSFTVSGSGKLLGVGNGDPSSHEADNGSQRHLFSGLALAIVQSDTTSGPITLTATADGLPPATIILYAGGTLLTPGVLSGKL